MLALHLTALALSAPSSSDPHEPVESHDSEHHTHRAIGLKLIDLNVVSEGELSAWLGAGLILELPASRRVVVEVAAQGLAGTPNRPGFALPVDVLVKYAWFFPRTVVTAGGGPTLTWMLEDGHSSLFPGALASVGGSYWLGERERWGILAELDVGGSIEGGAFVTEIELATGVVFAL